MNHLKVSLLVIRWIKIQLKQLLRNTLDGVAYLKSQNSAFVTCTDQKQEPQKNFLLDARFGRQRLRRSRPP